MAFRLVLHGVRQGSETWEKREYMTCCLLTGGAFPRLYVLFIGRTDAEAEAPVLSPPDLKSRLIGKDAEPGKD